MHTLLKQFAMLISPLWLWRWPIIPISMSWLTYILRVCVITCFMIYAFLSGCCVFEITSINDWQQYWTYYHIELTIRHSHGSIQSLFFFSFQKSTKSIKKSNHEQVFFFQWPGMELLFCCEYDRHIQCEINNDKSSTL